MLSNQTPPRAQWQGPSLYNDPRSKVIGRLFSVQLLTRTFLFLQEIPTGSCYMKFHAVDQVYEKVVEHIIISFSSSDP